MSNQTISGPVLLIMTGFTCNNNCLMCSVKPKGLNNQPRNTKEIISDIEKGKKLHYERIEFTGGEPTMRADLPALIAKADELGYREIALSTNCRTLSHLNFLKSLQKQGLNRITTTLHGYDPKSHDSITRVPGSFLLTTKGIKNSLDMGIVTSVNTVVFNQTAVNLKKIGVYLASLGVEHWTLLDLIPDGYANKDYTSLSVEPKHLETAFSEIEPIIPNFISVNIMDFPYCIFPPKLLINRKCNFINAKGRTEIIKQIGYKPKRFKEKRNVYYDFHKIRSVKCQRCAYNDDCGGTWVPYFKQYGTSFIKPISKKIPR